jgi:hypothetical protein
MSPMVTVGMLGQDGVRRRGQVRGPLRAVGPHEIQSAVRADSGTLWPC